MATSSFPLPTPLPPHNLSPQKQQQSPSQFSIPEPLFDAINEPSKPRKPPTIRSRLSKLCREGKPHIARQMFDTLPKPTTVLWNTIIIGLICNNLPFEALLFYSKMRFTSSTKCDSYTYSSVLKACADTRLLRVGKALHCHVLRSQLFASRIVYNSLLNMYSTCLATTSVSQCREVDTVCRVFNTMKKRNVVAWNTIVSWFVKTERFHQAVWHFKLMVKMGISPTPISFVNVFPAVSGTCDHRLASVLYGMLVKFGDGYVNDLFTVSSAIVMFSELGCPGLSRKIFDGCLDKNVEVWNSMIGGYLQNNCCVEAFELFSEALSSEHVVLDNVSYITAVSTASQLQQVYIGQQLHGLVLKNSTALSITVLNAVIVMYSRCNYIQEAFKVFDGMVERDIVSWNTMITALVQNELDEEGLMLVYEMQNQGFIVDAVTVIAILSAASNLRNEAIGKQTHAYLIRNGIEFQGMDSYLIDMYAKSGLIKKSQIVFEESDELSRDQATWNSMVSSNTQNGLIEEAFAVFRQMLARNVLPNAVTMSSILPACSQIGSIALGKQLHAFAIRHFLDENLYVGTALIDMYSKLGAVASAESVFALAPTKSAVTYTNMILGYGQHGMGAAALALFDEMQSSGITPDAVTFIAILSACSYAGLVDEGLNILESMEIKYGVEPSVDHYACVVDMLGRDGRLTEAFELAETLGEEGSAIQAWGSLLAACKTHKQYELAKTVAKKLLDMESRHSSSGYHVLLSQVYADEGYWDLADRVRKEMRERGERKELGCSWIETSGYVNYFASKDMKHQKSDRIYEMMSKLASNMEDAGYAPLCYGDTQMDEISDGDD